MLSRILGNIKLKPKIFGFVFICLLILLAASSYFWQNAQKKVQQTDIEITVLSQNMIPLLTSIVNIDKHTLAQEIHLQKLLNLSTVRPKPELEINRVMNKFKGLDIKVSSEIKAGQKMIQDSLTKSREKDAITILSQLSSELRLALHLYRSYHKEGLSIVEKNLESSASINRLNQMEKLRETEEILNQELDDIIEKIRTLTIKQAAITSRHEKEVGESMHLAASISLLIFLACVLVIYQVTKKLVEPISELVKGVDKIATGSLNTRLEVEGRDEVANLTKSFNSMADGLEKGRSVRDMFGKYLDPRVVSHIIDQNGLREVERRNLTIYFSDIKGFSTISESLEPAKLVDLLNAYFSHCAKPILSSQGVIDKYIGDAIMAYWGPPFTPEGNAAQDACLAALNQTKQLELFRKKLPEILGLRKGIPNVTHRIGLATGPAVVGNLGSEKAQSYTAIGDTVNVASRLEGINKNYGTTIMLDSATRDKVKDSFTTRLMDRIIPKGKTESHFIYELIDDEKYSHSDTEKWLNYWHEMQDSRMNENYSNAKKLLKECLSIYPDDKASLIFLDAIDGHLKKAA